MCSPVFVFQVVKWDWEEPKAGCPLPTNGPPGNCPSDAGSAAQAHAQAPASAPAPPAAAPVAPTGPTSLLVPVPRDPPPQAPAAPTHAHPPAAASVRIFALSGVKQEKVDLVQKIQALGGKCETSIANCSHLISAGQRRGAGGGGA